jgi:hypothetical protein
MAPHVLLAKALRTLTDDEQAVVLQHVLPILGLAGGPVVLPHPAADGGPCRPGRGAGGAVARGWRQGGPAGATAVEHARQAEDLVRQQRSQHERRGPGLVEHFLDANPTE